MSSVRWKKTTIIGFPAIHLLAALAFFPWFFSWTGVVLLFVGCFVFGVLGINIGYHRLLTHRGLSCPRWLEHTFVILGVCCVQDSPSHWVAVHRRHHQFSDVDQDPHSPLVSFIWAHMGWLLVKVDALKRGPLIARYAKDISRDPLYAWIESHSNWIKIALASTIAYFAIGYSVVALSGGTIAEAVQFGASIFVWGAFLRIVLVWHMTWAVNSVTHVWGYRNYETPDVSRNNLILGILVWGEGWHNNHHADPRSARHGHKWWELDVAWLIIRFLMALGLAKNIALPSPILAEKFNFSAPERAVRYDAP